MLSLVGEDLSEDRIETYVFWTYTHNAEITTLLIDELWPTALEGSLDMLIWLIIMNQDPDSVLRYALEQRVRELFPLQEEALYEPKGSTLTSLERFFDLLYYQEMKNDALSGLRQAVIRWVVYKSDDLLQTSMFVTSLLQRFPGFKYMFAKAWADIRRTHLPHGWADALEGQSIRSIAVITDSDDPADFDGFDAWEQRAQRQNLDPGWITIPSVVNTKPTQGKSVRFMEGDQPNVDPLPTLMAHQGDSPRSLSTSNSSFGLGESLDLSSYQLAFALRGGLQPLSTDGLGSHHLPEATEPMEAETRGRPPMRGSAESIETRRLISNDMDVEVPASKEGRPHNPCHADKGRKSLCIREQLPYDTERVSSFQIDLGGGQPLPTTPEQEYPHSNGSDSRLG